MSATKQKPIKASSIKSKKQFDKLAKSGALFLFDEPYGPRPKVKKRTDKRK